MPFDSAGRFVSRRHIRSSTAKKDAIRREPKRTKDIHDIRTWPPGSFILIDTRKMGGKVLKNGLVFRPFVGLGTVVANDGKTGSVSSGVPTARKPTKSMTSGT